METGDIVTSKKGRDKGRNFIITEIVNEKFVLTADGDLRKLNKPKLKNIKHVKYICKGDKSFINSDAGGDKRLKEYLKNF